MSNSSYTVQSSITNTTDAAIIINPSAPDFYITIHNAGPETLWYGHSSSDHIPLYAGETSEEFYVVGTNNSGTGSVHGFVYGNSTQLYSIITTL